MTKVTNTAEGPRGVETDSGTVFVDPGTTVDVEIKDGHQLYDGLTEGDGFSGMTKAQLMEHMDARGIAYEADDNKADLLRKIEGAAEA